MDQWEALIEACPTPVDLRYFHKAIQAAGVVLKEDLAHFEIEWILQTLLHEPVGLLTTVQSKRADETWFKVIGDAFKLLGDAAERYHEYMDSHFELVVELCALGFDSQTRKQALQCLSSIARVSPIGATHASRHIASLEETTTAKAPLAQLIGTICEHHPETVENDINRLWRIFLNQLDCSKNSDTLTSSLLVGVLGLLKHFGRDLPTAELATFYDKLASEYIQTPRCKDVCLKILADHSDLFRERISRDLRTRTWLWGALHGGGTDADAIRATSSVYKAICGCVQKERLQQIATTELLPQTSSHRVQVKYTALRLLSHLARCGVSADVCAMADAHALEFRLRHESVSYDDAEAVAWCIESSLPGSEALLQTAMLFYKHLPASRRKSIVVHGILNAADTIRTTAIIFFISETTQNDTSLETHLPLWMDIFDSDGGKDAIVLDKSRYVFGDFMGYLVFVLEGFLEQGIESPGGRLSTLLQLTSRLLEAPSRGPHSNDHCLVLLPLLTELLKLRPDAETMCAARAAVAHVADPTAHAHELGQLYQVVRIDRCKDEALLCECCLALVEASVAVATGDALLALQIIFARNDVEPHLLSKALAKLEFMILESDNLNSSILNDILRQVQKIQARKDLTGRDARVLRRDVLMFLGKYGGEIDNSNNIGNIVIVKLMDTLILNLANPDEGTAYKINLQKILYQALEHEDPNSLQILLTILCANLSRKREPSWQAALSQVCVALSRAHARGSNPDPRALQPAVLMCDSALCLQGMVQYIGEEKSPGVRKMLSDALEALLREKEQLISAATEHALVMMSSHESTIKRAGLNVTETLISSLKEHNSLTKKLLPELLILIAKTFEIDSDTTFDTGSKLLLEKIELFDRNEIEKLIKDLLKVILIENVKQNTTLANKMADVKNKMAESEVRIFRITTKMILDFIKCVIDYKNEDKKKIWVAILEILDKENCDFERSLYVLGKFKHIFGYSSDIERGFINKLISIEVKMEEPYFCMEVVLTFLQEYVDMLLELYYQETLEFLSKYITELSPPCIKHLHRNIKSCLSVYTNKRTPATLQKSLETWCSKLPIVEITNSIEKESFTTDHALAVFSLKIMLSYCDVTTLTDVSNAVKKWPKILLKLYSSGYIANYLKSKMSYLTDILAVSVRFLKVTDVKKLILEGSNLEGLPSEKIGIQYCRFFMHVFYEVLVRKPFILLDPDVNQCCVLLNDIVKYTVKKKCTDKQYDTVLDLVDQLWPTYEVQTTFDQKHLLLLDLSNFPRKLGPDSNPLQWAVNNVVYSEASPEDKARLIGVLPGGEHYSAAYRSFASLLPTRLSEMRGAALFSLRALLDAIATCRDLALLDIVITLASGDESKGWWDEAMESCMGSVAAAGDLALCKAAYSHCGRSATVPACRRILLPLLRYSTSSFNEEFFSNILDELLKPREQKVVSANRIYHKSIIDHTKLFAILQVACEKIPDSSLESPNSALYKEVVPKVTQSWYLIRVACRLCDRLKKKPLPEGADSKFKEDYRQFQCANYNCFVSAICRRRPDAEFYIKNLFDAAVWDLLLEQDKEYQLRIRHQWTQRSTITVSGVAGAMAGEMAGSARTVRTRLFLRTLSESPLMYDLVEQNTDDEQPTTQDMSLPSCELNVHECAGSLTALLRHVAALWPLAAWPQRLAAGLQRCGRNARWLLAQVICNCVEELRPHASILRAALLEVVASTAITDNGTKLLNGLHIDILETLLEWGDDSPSPSEALDASLTLLLATGRHHKTHKPTHTTIVNVAVKFLQVYGGVVNVSDDVFEAYLTDDDTPKALLVHIPTVLPAMLTKIEAKQFRQLPKTAEVIGMALNKCTDKQQHLTRLRKALDAVRRSHGAEFVRMLYYAQAGCAGVCDEYNFRMATNLAQKLVGHDKTKCLRILTTYVSNSSSDYTQEMFETVDLPELMSQGNIEAFNLVAEGVKVMSESVKKRLVMVAAKYCDHSLVDVRKAAGGVMLKAFEDMFRSPSEPASKRPKPSSSALISSVQSKDVYTSTLLGALSCACVDQSDDVSGALRASVARLLSKKMGIRFVECFLLTVYLPTICYNNSRSLSVCVFALLEMLLLDLRSQDRFKNILLRDEPLQRSASSASSKLLTKSRTYQGTFRRTNFTSRKNSPRVTDTNQNGPEIDVQISIDHILDTFMKFAKEVPQASEVLCLAIVQAIKPGFDLAAEMATALAAILDEGVNELTPFVAELCGIFIDDVCKIDGIQNTIKRLENVTKNTEGEGVIKFLSQEIRLRSEGPELFVLGTVQDQPPDVAMDEDVPFSIEGLTSAFGSLSNWDCLTVQQKTRIRATLPPLWTDHDTFATQLNSYTGSSGWFGKMAGACRGAGRGEVLRWLRAAERWPITRLHRSAVTEAVLMLEGRESALQFPSDIRPGDCLAEWAGRLMIRTAYQTSLPCTDGSEERSVLSRSHELKWCEIANEKELGAAVLKCVKRNKPLLSSPSSPLPWLVAALQSRRCAALLTDDAGSLQRALQVARAHATPSNTGHALHLQRLVLMLQRDLHSLSRETFQEVFEMVDSIGSGGDLYSDTRVLRSIYELAMSYYDDLWETDAATQSQQSWLVSEMTDILARTLNLGPLDEDLLAVILGRLDQCTETIDETAANKLLQLIHSNITCVDDFTIDYLLSLPGVLPPCSLSAHPLRSAREDQAMVKYKRCFQLLCDPEYTLLQYCSDLRTALKRGDEDQWESIFRRMKEKLFENPYSGQDYQLLNRYKAKLYEICEYDGSSSWRCLADRVLKEAGRGLSAGAARAALPTPQLCPALARCGDCPPRLLGLPPGVTVTHVQPQVAVLSSIRRPVVFLAVCSDGRSRRYLLKSGEPPRADAAAQRAVRGAQRGGAALQGYEVTPLSEDCGLIEFLEDHETLRAMIGADVLDAALESVPPRPDDELILAPMPANLAQHRQMCAKVPSHLLRDALARRSVTEQDRMTKINNFQDSLASTTIITWILAVGDRHLENILCSTVGGALCHVDWAGALTPPSAAHREPAPARLTRNMLAVCDHTVLEARLQQTLACLRRSYRAFSAVIKISFQWMGEPFQLQYPHIRSILRGSALSVDARRALLERSAGRERHLELLERVLEPLQCKTQYTLDEQISCLLRHCTAPSILSVTRADWEPWV